MATVLLTSEKFVKEKTNISDNISTAYLIPAIRETQDVDITLILGSALVAKLQALIADGTINADENIIYKNVLDKAQYPLAYGSIAKLIPIAGVKIDNFGINQAQDENIRALGVEDIATVIGWYTKKFDSYSRDLMRYVLSVKEFIPELDDCTCGQIRAHLTSAATTGLFLGGMRGRILRTPKQ